MLFFVSDMGAGWTQSWVEEWELQKLHLLSRRPQTLLQPCWNIHPAVWLVYRSGMLVSIISWCVYAALVFNTPKFLIFLSHISYILLGLYHLVALINLVWTFIHVRLLCQQRARHGTSGGSAEPMGTLTFPVLLRLALGLQWFLHAVVGSFALCVSFLYWAMNDSRHALTAFTVNLHLANSVQTMVDLLLSSVCVHLCHFLYTLLAAAVYVTFILTYWLAGCTNLSGQPYIYSFIDFGRRPLVAALVILVVCLVALPFFHFLLWNLQLLRETMARGRRGRSVRLRTEVWWWARVGGRPVSDLPFSLDSESPVFETPS